MFAMLRQQRAAGASSARLRGDMSEHDSSGFVSRSVTCKIPLAPVSQQSTGKKKRIFARQLRESLPKTDWLFSDDTNAMIIWRCTEERKYESPTITDIDNIIKPILDSLVGSLIIDDTVDLCLGIMDRLQR